MILYGVVAGVALSAFVVGASLLPLAWITATRHGRLGAFFADIAIGTLLVVIATTVFLHVLPSIWAELTLAGLRQFL